jgi:hypothetical protein
MCHLRMLFVPVLALCVSESVAAPARVVDMSVAAKQPNLRVVENKISGSDPLSVAGECIRHTARSGGNVESSKLDENVQGNEWEASNV